MLYDEYDRISDGERTSKHFRQNVCWHGSTRDVVSSRSRHTEHSSKSFSVFTSIATAFDAIECGSIDSGASLNAGHESHLLSWLCNRI